MSGLWCSMECAGLANLLLLARLVVLFKGTCFCLWQSVGLAKLDSGKIARPFALHGTIFDLFPGFWQECKHRSWRTQAKKKATVAPIQTPATLLLKALQTKHAKSRHTRGLSPTPSPHICRLARKSG